MEKGVIGMVTKHTATFANGSIMTRTSRTRVYTHAWKATWINRMDEARLSEDRRGKPSGVSGFAGSYDLAHAAARSALADSKYGKHPGEPDTRSFEIVETVRVTK
jgi:hypothetical protein